MTNLTDNLKFTALIKISNLNILGGQNEKISPLENVSRMSNLYGLSMYSPPVSRPTSPKGLSPLENLSMAQLSALAPVSMSEFDKNS